MPAVGEVWKHENFYTDPHTGRPLPKYLVVLAVHPLSKDITYKLLTSRERDHVKVPACMQDGDRPGFYIGIPLPLPPLDLETWVDLREAEDFDDVDFQKKVGNGVLTHIFNLDPARLCPALSCAAYAQDTTKAQKNQIMAAKEKLGCP